MDSVAQKTLFFKNLLILGTFLLNISSSFAQTDIYQTENLTYKVSLNGLKLGEAIISYQPNKEKNTYKLLARAKTEGFAKTIYSLKSSTIINGVIENNQLKPMSQSAVLKRTGHKSNKVALFDYDKELLKIIDNRKSKINTFILLNKAKDIFSELYSLRFNTDLTKNLESTTTEKTMQFTNKTLNSKIMISAPFNFNINKNKNIVAHNVVVESQRVKYYPLKEEDLSLINSGKAKSEDYLLSTKSNSNYKLEKNIRVIVSSDANKTPLVIYYSTDYGTFKAVLKK